jgi:AcrR family transcriptional regulator
MPRPRSDEKRSAILEAAIRIIVKQGLSAPTMVIAKEAGVANGSLFTYFETKADLFNQLFLELKMELATGSMNLPQDAEVREQFLHLWKKWMNWAVSNPEKRRALAQLSVSDEITPASRLAGHKMMAHVADLLDRSRAHGSMQKVSMGFLVALMNSVAEATMDYMTQDPANAKKYSKEGFDAFWRMLT